MTELETARTTTGEDEGLSFDIAERSLKIEELSSEYDTAKLGKEQKIVAARLNVIKTKISDCRNMAKLLPELESAEESMAIANAEWRSTLTDHIKDIDEAIIHVEAKETEILIIEDELPMLEAQVKEADYQKQRKDGLEVGLQQVLDKTADIRNRQLDVVGRIAALEQSMEMSSKAKAELASIKEKLRNLFLELERWTVLQKGYSNDGIIALEIDDAGPQLSAMANKLLHECYGPRFSVRIDTQSMKNDGTASEDFDIVVIDNEVGVEDSLSEKSGGEITWVEDSVTKAIALYHAEKNGRRYSTLMTDERDGALAEESKRQFFRLKREVLALGGFTGEFYISHSSQSQDFADFQLVFSRNIGVTITSRN